MSKTARTAKAPPMEIRRGRFSHLMDRSARKATRLKAVLAALEQADRPLTRAEIAERCGYSGDDIQSALSRLERKGFISAKRWPLRATRSRGAAPPCTIYRVCR